MVRALVIGVVLASSDFVIQEFWSGVLVRDFDFAHGAGHGAGKILGNGGTGGAAQSAHGFVGGAGGGVGDGIVDADEITEFVEATFDSEVDVEVIDGAEGEPGIRLAAIGLGGEAMKGFDSEGIGLEQIEGGALDVGGAEGSFRAAEIHDGIAARGAFVGRARPVSGPASRQRRDGGQVGGAVRGGGKLRGSGVILVGSALFRGGDVGADGRTQFGVETWAGEGAGLAAAFEEHFGEIGALLEARGIAQRANRLGGAIRMCGECEYRRAERSDGVFLQIFQALAAWQFAVVAASASRAIVANAMPAAFDFGDERVAHDAHAEPVDDGGAGGKLAFGVFGEDFAGHSEPVVIELRRCGQQLAFRTSVQPLPFAFRGEVVPAHVHDWTLARDPII